MPSKSRQITLFRYTQRHRKLKDCELQQKDRILNMSTLYIIHWSYRQFIVHYLQTTTRQMYYKQCSSDGRDLTAQMAEW